jgi:S-(hydroxymethyl)glutathione dehydrogenase / alcohol dehydrogenase
MKAAYLTKLNSPLKISKNIKFRNLDYGQVLIKNYYTGVCKSQIYEIYSGRDNKKYIPHLLGHEATGIVVEKHSSVKKVKKGDRVILTWLKCKGIQSKNPEYYDKLKKINSGSVTTFSNFSIVSENRLLKLPKDISLKKGVILGCAFPTGSGMVLNSITSSKNKKIAFIGLGGVGTSALLTSLNFVFKEIYAFDVNKDRLNFLNKFIKNDKKVNFSLFDQKTLKKFKNYFDYVIETSGSIKGIESGFKILINNGKMIFASHPSKGKMIKLDPFDLIKGKKIFGSWGGDFDYEKNCSKIFEIFKGIKNFDQIFQEKTYNFSEINFAIKDLKNGKVLRPLIKLR